MDDSDVALLLRVPKTPGLSFAATAVGHPLTTTAGLRLEPLFETAPQAVPGAAVAAASVGSVQEWYIARPAGTSGRNPWMWLMRSWIGLRPRA